MNSAANTRAFVAGLGLLVGAGAVTPASFGQGDIAHSPPVDGGPSTGAADAPGPVDDGDPATEIEDRPPPSHTRAEAESDLIRVKLHFPEGTGALYRGEPLLSTVERDFYAPCMVGASSTIEVLPPASKVCVLRIPPGPIPTSHPTGPPLVCPCSVHLIEIPPDGRVQFRQLPPLGSGEFRLVQGGLTLKVVVFRTPAASASGCEAAHIPKVPLSASFDDEALWARQREYFPSGRFGSRPARAISGSKGSLPTPMDQSNEKSRGTILWDPQTRLGTVRGAEVFLSS